MDYYSTNNKKLSVSLREAVLTGMPSDHGLYMPRQLQVMPESFIHQLSQLSLPEIAFQVANTLLGEDLPQDVLQKIVAEAINFDAPLHRISDKVKTLELFHGPTLAFKDYGARFMSRLMAYFVHSSGEKLKIVVATSGDTGSAVANGFYKVPGIEVIVLYPSGKVSDIQEKQIATLGENITALEVNGTFDDCQKLVKQALVDPEILSKIKITSANSINISRLIPQVFYYFGAFAQLNDAEKKHVVMAVPSGNFGNLTAGLIAKKMGLPIQKFVAATNINDVVPEYLDTALFKPRPSKRTISNAMDVGNPSNFARIMDLYNQDYDKVCDDIAGKGYTDAETRAAIAKVYQETGYVCDPHGAVGYLGLTDYLAEHPEVTCGIFAETAHPAKFGDVVEPEIGSRVNIPERLAKYLEREKAALPIEAEFGALKAILLEG